MARQGWVVLFQLALLSSVLKAGSCDFKPINLKPPAAECNMSSAFSDSQFGTSLNCTGALNGNRNTAWIVSGRANANCVYTKKEPKQYWLVNLLQPRNIHRITIYPETYEGGQYMINTTVLVDSREVYRFPNRGVTTVTLITSSNSTSNSLPVRGQIILLTRGALIYATLCELEADECSSNTFGPVCSDNCSRYCQANGAETTCDSITGNCIIGCEDGWWGGRCDRECPQGCDGPCDRTTGLCSQCKENFVSPNCTGCKTGFYGTECQSQCGKGCMNRTCGQLNGACECQMGWAQPKCVECTSGYYGADTCVKCGYCRDPDVCDITSGHCPNGCAQNFAGDRCDKCSANRWGADCSKECGNCAGDGSCVLNTGECTTGCQDGYQGFNCTLAVTAPLEDPPGVAALVGGAAAAVVVIVVVAVVVIFVVVRRRRGKESKARDDRRSLQSFNDGDLKVADSSPDANSGAASQTRDSALPAGNTYDLLERYVNPDDIKVYTELQRIEGDGSQTAESRDSGGPAGNSINSSETARSGEGNSDGLSDNYVNSSQTARSHQGNRTGTTYEYINSRQTTRSGGSAGPSEGYQNVSFH